MPVLLKAQAPKTDKMTPKGQHSKVNIWSKNMLSNPSMLLNIIGPELNIMGPDISLEKRSLETLSLGTFS